MLVCSCRAVTAREVETAIAKGARTVDAVIRTCGAGADCGSCVGEIEDRIACASRRSHDGKRPGLLHVVHAATG